ncbi:macrolide family glycosyltransferase [Polymorphospora rubra]|uniref:UDP glycosyltransferase n=1 Tax=Polymorphospora rubra TaxID=338584 RepID=A0A810NC69_9ACTN|nr:macrolide family glycosyltransferase [Polymorphospora rubra]BCJ69679.1 UDP glycosyltransferase [Polymorphospora rubra]
MRESTHIAMVGSTAPSHIYPSLGLIRELVDRGHRVAYAVGEPLTGLIAPTGAEPVAHPSILPQGDTAWPEDPGAAMRVFLDEGIAVLPRLTARYDTDRPDLVLYDIGGLPGPLLGARYGVPAVQLSPAMVAWDGYEEDMAEVLTALYESPSGRDYYATLGSWLADNGIRRDPRRYLARPDQVLSLIPRVMQPNADRVPDQRVRFVGPCLDPARLTDTSWEPPVTGRRVLLVSFGTAYNDQLPVYRACLDGFADSPWHVVLAIGDKVDPADLGSLPDNVEVHRSVPQLAVLAHASAFVTHAGMGSCSEALWFGVPTVAIPQAVDQFGNADRLVDAGVGRLLPAGEVTAATLRAAVDAVADDPRLRHRLTEVRTEVRANGGLRYAADAVESFLAGR